MAAAIDFLDVRLPERFWNKVQPCPMSGCWIWAGGSTKGGYGVVTVDGRRASHVQSTAHCWAYETLIGRVPLGLELDHLCRNTLCCNPAHLEAVTHAVNLARSNSLSTKNAAATACPSGHPYDEANTYRNPRNGNRQCRICRRSHDLNQKARKAASCTGRN